MSIRSIHVFFPQPVEFNFGFGHQCSVGFECSFAQCSIQSHGVVNENLYREGAGFKDFVHVVKGVDYSVEFCCVV